MIYETSDDLMPCPFCGNRVRFVYDVDGMPAGIWCGGCHMKAVYSDLKETKTTTCGQLHDQLLKHWNQRKEKG